MPASGNTGNLPHGAQSWSLVGGLNVCLSNNLDTDRPDLNTDADEPEAEVLRTFMQEAALDDLFRFLHPLQKAHTHISVGERQDQAQRRLDYVLGTHELVQPGTRMGIHAGYTLDGDHLPVICDLHINSAGLAPLGTCPNMAAPHLLQTKTPP